MQPGQVLFSRYEDGVRPVTVLAQGWAVEGLGEFTTAKDLLAALTGHPAGRHWSVERYFRLGQYKPAPKQYRGHLVPKPKRALVESNVLDLVPLVMVRSTPDISVPVVVKQVKLGIDLSKRAHEVRKLLFAGFGRRMFLGGYDPEDVLQEVYKGLLVRNAGKCPYDPSKSSFGHYVHMVISCVLSNYHRKQHRVHEMEQVGLTNLCSASEGGGAEDWGHQADVASNTSVPSSPTLYASDSLLLEAADSFTDYLYDIPDSRLATQVLPLLLAGVPRDHLAKTLGTSNAAITRAITHLKKHAHSWKESENVSPDI